MLFRGPNRSGRYSRNWRSSYDPSSCSQPGSSADPRLSPVILRLVTLLCGMTYTTPQVAAAVSGPVTTAVRGLVATAVGAVWCGAFASCSASLPVRMPAHFGIVHAAHAAFAYQLR